MFNEINREQDSFDSQLDDSQVVYSDDLNSSQEIQKLKQRLYLKQSLLETFADNTEINFENDSYISREDIGYKQMPAFLYTYQQQYTVFNSKKSLRDLFHYYQQIILLSDIKVPKNILLFNNKNKMQNSENKQKKLKINLVCQEAIQKNIYSKIIQFNVLSQQETYRYAKNSQQQTQIALKKFQTSQYFIALKLLLQQFKESSKLLFSFLVIGLVLSLICLFLIFLVKRADLNKPISVFNLTITLYYLLTISLSSLFLYKSAFQGNQFCIKFNKYFSYIAIITSFASLGLIFQFDNIYSLPLILTLQIIYILLFIFYAVYSIKIFNLYHKLEYLLGIKSFNLLK
ncbi:hypothetical protein ABPG74_004391 [Tetrahymena malaccensis]